MFTWLVYLLIGIAIVMFIVAILTMVLNIILGSILKKYGNNISEQTAEQLVNEIMNINMFLKVFIIIFNLKGKLKKLAADKIFRLVKRIRIYLIIVAISNCLFGFLLAALGMSVQNLNLSIESFLAGYNVWFSDDECICYAKCTDNSEIDNKCTYELLFGPTEYDKLVKTLTLSVEDELQFSKCTTGFDKGQFIIKKLNNNAVDCYKEIVGTSGNFRSGDGKNRKEMSNDELKEDLILLLSDYKVNGRNPNCDCCKDIHSSELHYICLGEPHYIPGFTWEDIWGSDDDDGGGGNTGSGTVLGHATGQYAITLDDGLSYYWYHQSSSPCACINCGDWSQMQWGVPGDYNTFGSDGCAVYSLAMIASNLSGQEITPTRLLKDLGCTIVNGVCDTTNSDSFNVRLIKREIAAAKVSQLYNINYKEIDSIDEANEILNGDGMFWDQWKDSTSKSPRVWLHGGSDFSWYANTGHFMAVREIDSSGNYYCLTSCGNGLGDLASEVMNYAETASNVFNHGTGGQRYAFWVESSDDESGGGGGGGGTINPVPPIDDPDIQDDINKGLYTAEDYNYLVALGGESSSYDGFYAVACCVRNRVNRNGSSYKTEVTKPGQFAGYHPDEIGNPRNDNVKKAAVAVLRGGESNIGDCYFFLGRVSGWDMWAEHDIDKFYNVGNNIYFNNWGAVHNKKTTASNAIIIYKSSTGTWYYPSGTFYMK